MCVIYYLVLQTSLKTAPKEVFSPKASSDRIEEIIVLVHNYSADKNRIGIFLRDYENTEVMPDAPVSLKITEVRTHGKFTLDIINFGEVGTSCLIRRHIAYIFNNKMKAIEMCVSRFDTETKDSFTRCRVPGEKSCIK